MPILPLVEQKQLNADSIISPVVEMPEGRKLSVVPNKSPADNVSRYNLKSTLAPGIDPSGFYPHDVKSEMASNALHSYPPPQPTSFKDSQSAQVNAYGNYTTNNAPSYSSQTYPRPQVPQESHSGYAKRASSAQSAVSWRQYAEQYQSIRPRCCIYRATAAHHVRRLFRGHDGLFLLLYTRTTKFTT